MVKRNTQKSKEKFRDLIINFELKKGTSTNEILRKLREKHLGMKRKTFLAKIRIKRNRVKRFDTSKYVPIKYRRAKKIITAKYLRFESVKYKENFMYRLSLAINDVPVHKKYVSFLLQAFSLDATLLMNKLKYFKELLLKNTNAYLGYNWNALAEWNHFHYYIAIEYPTQIILDGNVLNTWIFMVERNGTLYTRSGLIDDVL